MENIKGNIREKKSNHDAKKIRKSGLVPGILYGTGINNTLFEIAELELEKEISYNGEHGVVNLELNGNTYTTLMKEVQRNPVNHSVIHVDFEKIDTSSEIVTEIPIHISGEDYVNSNGGFIQREKNTVKVKCKMNEIPPNIEIDLSKYTIGDTLKVSEINLSSNIKVIDDPNTVIVAVARNNNKPLENEAEEPIVVTSEKHKDIANVNGNNKES